MTHIYNLTLLVDAFEKAKRNKQVELIIIMYFTYPKYYHFDMKLV